MRKNDLILFFRNDKSTFSEIDVKILKKRFNVKIFDFRQEKSLRISISFFSQLVFLLKNFRKSDIFFIWFADYHAFLPVLFSKFLNRKSFVILGGSDTVCMPEFNYGVFVNKTRGLLVNYVIKNCSLLLPVNLSLIDNLKKNGINLDTRKFIELPTGYNYEFWNFNCKTRDIDFLCVSTVNSIQRYHIKGVDRFFELARKFHKYVFVLVGFDIEEELINNIVDIPDNVRLLNSGNQDYLKSIYSRSKFITQLSRSEGLPNTVCEGMLCGCVPIVSKIPSLEHFSLIGTFYEDLSVDFDFFHFFNENSIKSVNYIKNNFSLKIREKNLLEIISKD